MTRVREQTDAEHRSAVSTVLDQLPMQVSAWDCDLRLRYANHAALANPNLDLAVGHDLHESIPAEYLELAMPGFEDALEGRSHRYERTASSLDGEPVDYVVDVAPIRSEGSVVGVRAIGTAVSRGFRARSLLRVERDRLGDAVSTGPQPRLRNVMRELALLPRDATLLQPEAITRILGELDDAVGDLRAVMAELRNGGGPATPAHVPVVPPAPDPEGTTERDGRASGAPPFDTVSSDSRVSEPSLSDLPSGDDGRWGPGDDQALFDSLPPAGAWGPDALCVVLNAQAYRSFGLPVGADVRGRPYRSIAGDSLADANEQVIRVALDGLPIATRLEYVDAQRVRHKGLVRFAPVRRGGERWAVGALLEVGDLLEADDAADEGAAELAADRQLLAADLHDHAIQLLYAAGLTLGAIADGTSPDVSEGLNNAVLCVAEALLRVHSTVGTLTREHADDAEDAVRRIVRRSAGALGFTPRVDVLGDARGLTPEVVDDLAAVLREALSNVARHAHAGQTHVVLSTSDDSVVLRVADDGVGVGSPTRSSGLQNMADRAKRHHGVFDVRPNEPRGTVVDWRARF